MLPLYYTQGDRQHGKIRPDPSVRKIITKAKAPHVRVLSAHAVQLGGFKTFLGLLIGLAELLISLILGLVTNVDLVVSRVRVDVIGLPVPLRYGHSIWREGLEMFLPLRSVSRDGSEACGGEQVLRVLRISAPDSKRQKRDGANKIESGEYMFHRFPVFSSLVGWSG